MIEPDTSRRAASPARNSVAIASRSCPPANWFCAAASSRSMRERPAGDAPWSSCSTATRYQSVASSCPRGEPRPRRRTPPSGESSLVPRPWAPPPSGLPAAPCAEVSCVCVSSSAREMVVCASIVAVACCVQHRGSESPRRIPEPPPPLLVDRSDQPRVAGRVEGAERFLGDAVRDLVEQSEGEVVADDGRELQDLAVTRLSVSRRASSVSSSESGMGAIRSWSSSAQSDST